MSKLTIIGNGYTADFLSKEALKNGFDGSIITRSILQPKKNIHYYNFYCSPFLLTLFCEFKSVS